ncbi:MAG: UDP-N-acetylglucosamine 1-carboxyvinyltransferase, partial [Chloroflexota bacterium]|nr:UDP-N-acetylglucosamine 1-carboxyvinyltransferase [Chloroflexota bacterium]
MSDVSPDVPVPGQAMKIQGPAKLVGDVTISGSKNAALPIMAATLLTDEEIILENLPEIDDVDTMADVLRGLGARVEVDRGATPSRITIQADRIHSYQAPLEHVRKLRGSFTVMGPLLARFGQAHSSEPGGDVLGYRPIDMHIKGFHALGAEIRQDGGQYSCEAQRLSGTKIFLDYPSVTGTENVLMAACLAEGHTTIKNAAPEPEVTDLIDCLNFMGARIQRMGANQLEIEGVKRLRGCRYRVIPDRIEAGTLAIAAAATMGEVTLERVIPDHLEAVSDKLIEIGADVTQRWDSLLIRANKPCRPTVLTTFPYPGFPTDLQAPFGTLLTQAEGESLIHELLYNDRLLYLKELSKMGAHCTIDGQFA